MEELGSGSDEQQALHSSPTSVSSSASDESTSTMPSRNAQRNAARPATPKREVDLSALLTAAQKTALVALVTDITDKMHQHISDGFDTPACDPGVAETGRSKSWLFVPSKGGVKSVSGNRRGNTKQGKSSPAQEQRRDEIVTNGENAVADPEATEAESSCEMHAELKKEVLAFFKKWQALVVKRVGDISTTRDPNAQQNTQQPSSKSSSKPSSKPSGKPTSNKLPVNKLVSPLLKTAGGDKQGFGTEPGDTALPNLYPPNNTALRALPVEKRALLLHSMLLLLLSLEQYTAYSRVLLLHLASSLRIPLHVLADDEVRVAKGLSQAAKELFGDEALQKRSEEIKPSRRGKAGPGTNLTGNGGSLPAPLVAAGIGSTAAGTGLGTAAAAGLLGAVAENGVAVGTLFGLFGARGAGKMLDCYTKDMQDFALLPLHGLLETEFREAKEVPPEDRRLRMVIGISGWLGKNEEPTDSWRALGHQSEVYALRWEVDALAKMGNSLEMVLKSATWSTANKEIMAHTTSAGPLRATWPASLLKISKVIDNHWSVGMVRADKAGLSLADAIANRIQGERGVSLVGYGLGSRVIYTCLMALAEKRVFGLVENAVLIGTPAPSEGQVWSAMRTAVAGRIINVFSTRDYMLGFLSRTGCIQYGLAGVQRIEGVHGVENADVTALVSSHMSYQHLVGNVLKGLGWPDINLGEVAKSQAALALMEEKLGRFSQKRDGLGAEKGAARPAQQARGRRGRQTKLEERVRSMAISK